MDNRIVYIQLLGILGELVERIGQREVEIGARIATDPHIQCPYGPAMISSRSVVSENPNGGGS